jgi:hypothetical protein
MHTAHLQRSCQWQQHTCQCCECVVQHSLCCLLAPVACNQVTVALTGLQQLPPCPGQLDCNNLQGSMRLSEEQSGIW